MPFRRRALVAGISHLTSRLSSNPTRPPHIPKSISHIGHRHGHRSSFPLPFSCDPFLRHHFSSVPSDQSHDISEILTDTTTNAAATSASAEVAAAAADSFYPVAALQYLIEGVHSFCGVNWWAAIALTTVLIRCATVPLMINQMKSTFKLNAMKPEMEEIKEQMQNSMDPQNIQEGRKRMTELFKKHGVTPFTPMKGIFIQGPIFISFFFAISNMAEKVPSFKEGGAYWFTDLTTPDPVYALPILTGLSFLTTVELNMQEGMEGNPMAKNMKNFSRILAVVTVPFTATFPKAIFFYWVTSNVFSLAYGLVLKHPPVKKFLNLPDIVSQTAPASQVSPPNLSFLDTSKSVFTTKYQSPSIVAEPPKSTERKVSVSSSAVISHRIRNLEKMVKSRKKTKRQ